MSTRDGLRNAAVLGSLVAIAFLAAGLSIFWHLAPRWEMARRLESDPDDATARALRGLLHPLAQDADEEALVLRDHALGQDVDPTRPQVRLLGLPIHELDIEGAPFA